MVKSLRNQILLWQGFMLLAIVGGLGAFVYLRIEMATMSVVDGELESAAQQTLVTLRAVSRDQFQRGDFELPMVNLRRQLLPPPGGRRKPPPPPRREETPLYVTVWSDRGQLLAHTAEERPFHFAETPAGIRPGVSVIRGRRGSRELFVRGPFDSTVMVQRSIESEQAELRMWQALLAVACGGAILIGLVSTAWITRRALQPIGVMSGIAARISSSNLSARIDIKNFARELQPLAETLNEAFERLAADFQRQARFTADASHELRTPLTVILGHLDLALREPSLDDSTRETLEACRRSAKRMKSLIEQLLLLARADAGKLLPDTRAFDLAAVAEECVDLLRGVARDHQVDVRIDAKPVEVAGDPQLISQAIVNLVNNAIVHNNAGGSVHVAIGRNSGAATVRVEDDGPGIAAEHLSQLFERFYRPDEARSRHRGGAGLGLAIAKSIAQAHGGDITVQSEPGRGTIFTLQLPQSAVMRAAAPAHATGPARDSSTDAESPTK